MCAEIGGKGLTVLNPMMQQQLVLESACKGAYPVVREM